jgi:hypothetical protein
MGRLTAWIASRRQSRRSARAHQHKSAGIAARPLGFERYEERIALSTNAAIEFASFEPHYFVGFIDANEGGAASEGGWILYSAVASDHTFLKMSGPTVHAMTMTRSDNAYFGGFTTSDADSSASLSSLRSDRDLGGFDYSLMDGESPELLATDNRVVPIPPPSSGPSGNEGGQISMTPFMGPSTLGLPSSGDLLYALKDSPALRPESIDAATDAPTATPADSLRGRAVVYEVAHADSRLSGSGARLDDSPAELDENSAWDIAHALNRASHHETSIVADGRAPASQVKLPAGGSENAPQHVHRDNASAMLMAEIVVHSKDASEAEVADDMSSAVAANETAADAAFEQWQNELTPAFEGREAAAATADIQQRRVLGAALFVLGAIPVTKAMRRHAQQDSVAHRPRERRPAPPITRE